MFNKKPMSQTALNLGRDENGNQYGGGSSIKKTFDISKVADGKSGLEQFKPHLGENRIDIIPFNAGPNHPFVVTGQCQEGDTVYSLDYYVHRNIGPAKQEFTCLQQYNRRCPLCEESKRLWKVATTDEQKNVAKEVRNKRRCIYIIHDLIDGKYYYYDVAWYSFEQRVNSRASIRNDPTTGAPMNPFDWENGKTIFFKTFEDTWNGSKFNKIDEGSFDLIDRAPLSDEVLNHSVDLSEGLIMDTEDDMDAALCGKPVVSQKAQSTPAQSTQNTTTQTTSQPTQSAPTQTQAAPAQAQTPTENLANQAMAAAQSTSQPSFDNMQKAETSDAGNGSNCPFGHNWGEADGYGECATCKVWDKCVEAQN